MTAEDQPAVGGSERDSIAASQPSDHAKRRERFSAAFPFVRIVPKEKGKTPKEPGKPWQAFWLDGDGRPRHFSHPDGDSFFDLLEARFGVPS